MDLFVLGMYAGNTIPWSLIVHSLNILAFRKKSYIYIYIYNNIYIYIYIYTPISIGGIYVCFFVLNNSFKCNPE